MYVSIVVSEDTQEVAALGKGSTEAEARSNMINAVREVLKSRREDHEKDEVTAQFAEDFLAQKGLMEIKPFELV